MMYLKLNADGTLYGFYDDKIHSKIPLDAIEVDNSVQIAYFNSIYAKPIYLDGKWVEGKTEEELLDDAFLNSLTPSKDEEENAKFEIKLIEKLTEWGIV